jgi:hypothetical protein
VDERYLHDLTHNQAYKGRLKGKNLSDDELKQVQMKAQQLRYMWVRQQIKVEKHKDKAEKMRQKLEEKARKEEEQRIKSEKERVLNLIICTRRQTLEAWGTTHMLFRPPSTLDSVHDHILKQELQMI